MRQSDTFLLFFSITISAFLFSSLTHIQCMSQLPLIKCSIKDAHIPMYTRWDVEAAALVTLYCSTLCWVKTFWMLCFICAVTQRWTKTCRSLLIPGLCVDSILLCCCGQYSFSTQWDREVSMDVSLAKAKSHFSSVAGAVKHMQPFIASWKGFSFKDQLLAHF